MPVVKPLDMKLQFVAPDGTVVSTLLLRGDERIWDRPKDVACSPELAAKTLREN
jgi:hypothetical protein